MQKIDLNVVPGPKNLKAKVVLIWWEILQLNVWKVLLLKSGLKLSINDQFIVVTTEDRH